MEVIMALKFMSSMEKCFLDDKICDQKEKNSFVMFKNERLSFQLAYSFDGVYNAMVSVDLSGDFAPYATVRQVVSVPVAYPVRNDTKCNSDCIRNTPGLYPDVIRPIHYDGQVKVIENQLHTLMIDVKLPENACVSDGNIIVTLSGTNISESAEAKIHVVNAELPPQKLIHTEWFYTDCIAEAYHTEAFSKKHWKHIKSFLKTAVDNGINMILTPVFTPELDTYIGGERMTTQLVDITVESKGNYSFDFNKLDRWIDMLDRCGIEYIEISHLFTQWGAKHAPKIMATVDGEYKKLFGWETDAHSEEYSTFLRTFLTALLSHLKAQGNDKRCFFHVSDEPHTGDEEIYTKSKESIADVLKGYPIMDALSNINFFNLGIIDHPIPANNRIKPFLEAKVPGLWTYYCVSQPIDVSNRYHAMPNWRNRSIGMQIYKYNIEGFLQWGYNFYNNQYSGDPINPYYEQSCDFSFPGGDPFSVYPHMDGTALESPRLVVFNEALQDIKAMKLAEKYTSHEEVVAVIENALGKELTFETCAKSSEIMLRIREDVNAIIKNAIKGSKLD